MYSINELIIIVSSDSLLKLFKYYNNKSEVVGSDSQQWSGQSQYSQV